MENKELLLAITELKSSLDKRFDDLEKLIDKRFDSVSEELYKIRNSLSSSEGITSEEFSGKIDSIEKEIQILNLDVKYLAGKSGILEMKINGLEKSTLIDRH